MEIINGKAKEIIETTPHEELGKLATDIESKARSGKEVELN